jgi:hypothetical protein
MDKMKPSQAVLLNADLLPLILSEFEENQDEMFLYLFVNKTWAAVFKLYNLILFYFTKFFSFFFRIFKKLISLLFILFFFFFFKKKKITDSCKIVMEGANLEFTSFI